MAKKNPKVDAYVAKAQPFAKPILKKLRATIHKACPKVVEEIKWNAPFYLYRDRVLCATMGFKAHCALVFWKGSLIKKTSEKAKTEVTRLRRIKLVSDLPTEKELIALLKIGMHLNEPTTKLPPRKERSTPLKVPNDFARALKANPKAHAHFKAFTPSKQKDYLYWIAGAKTEETRERRMETAIDWINEGKARNWKYEATKKSR